MEDVVQGRGRRASRAQYTHRVEHAATRRQQHGNVVSGRQLVIHNDAEDAQTGHTFDARARRRWRRRRSIATCREDDLLRLVAV